MNRFFETAFPLLVFFLLFLIPQNRSAAWVGTGSNQTPSSINLVQNELKTLQTQLSTLKHEHCEKQFSSFCQDLSDADMLLKEVRGEVVDLEARKDLPTPSDLTWMRTRLVEVEQTLHSVRQ